MTTSVAAPRLFLDLLGGRLRLGGVAPQDDDLGPCLGQALGDAQTDSAVAARDDRHLAAQVEEIHFGLHWFCSIDALDRHRRHDRCATRIVDR